MISGLSPAKIVGIGLLGIGIGIGIRQYGSLSDRLAIEVGGTQTGSLDDSSLPTTFESDDSFVNNFPPVEIGSYQLAASRAERRAVIDEILDEQLEPPPSTLARRRPLPIDSDEAPPDLRPRPLQLVSDEQPTESAPAFGEETNEELPAPSAGKIEQSAETPNDETDGAPAVRVARKPDGVRNELDLDQIDQLINKRELLEAHRALSKIFWQQPEYRSQIQERIDATAKAIYFSPQYQIQEPYVVQAGDQLRRIATKHRIPWQYLARLNKVDPKRIREGQKLKVIDGPFGAVVTLSDFEIVLHHNGQYVRSYRVCIGKNESSPVGKFKVLNKVVNPQYTDPDGKVFAGDDPKNPLGKYWLDLGDSYGIHGTIEPDSIGKAESRGCIRLLNDDVAEIHDILDLGSEVIIRR